MTIADSVDITSITDTRPIPRFSALLAPLFAHAPQCRSHAACAA